jgi:ectoine hydroxylase-related dioxygenase (phytanoyl-CoA dioxygenase family)
MSGTINEEYVVSRVDEEPHVLRERFAEYGYLFFKRFVAAQKCEALMDEFLEVLKPHLGYDATGKLPIATGEPFFETDPIWDRVYPLMQSLESFHSFFHDQPVLDLMRLVSNDQVFVYPIKMARISTPGKIGYETPPHQDAYSHHAGPTMAGIWVALHDVTADMGRVKVLPGSHKQGVRKVLEAQGVGGVQCEIFPEETSWHVSDYERGDVLIFHSCAVHKAEPNTASQSARLSVDTRFCDYGAPVFSTNLEPHHGWRIEGLGWESIYKNWHSDELQYYWKDYPALF